MVFAATVQNMKIEIDFREWCKKWSIFITKTFHCFLAEWITLISVAVHWHSFFIWTHWMRASSTMIGKWKLICELQVIDTPLLTLLNTFANCKHKLKTASVHEQRSTEIPNYRLSHLNLYENFLQVKSSFKNLTT